jgi:sigma-B regulation protein RsbU (phosphoserine phosphatase)
MKISPQPDAPMNESQLTASILEQARVLALLYDIGKELTSILDRDALLRKIGERVKSLVDYHLFNVMILNPDTNRLEHAFSIKYDERVHGHQTLALGEGLCGTAALERKTIRVSDVSTDPRYIRCELGVGVKSELVVPLVVQDRVLGVLDLENLEPDSFSESHEQMLSTLASSVAIALENASLYDRLCRVEQRRKEDLQRAREVQRLLLPRETPRIQGTDIEVVYLPAQELGGDFYDFLPYGEGCVAIAAGDVSGKGPAAALLASLGVGILREHAMHQPTGPAELLADLNGHLLVPGRSGQSIAMTFGVYRTQTRELKLANAGFPPPLVLSGGRVQPLELFGTPLGLLPNSTYDSVSLHLQPGDAVVFCSDGLIERTNGAGDEYGTERLISTLVTAGNCATARQIAAIIMSSVDQYANNNPHAHHRDDCTLVVLRVVERQNPSVTSSKIPVENRGEFLKGYIKDNYQKLPMAC